MSSDREETRSHEHALEIHAPSTDVWKAITEAEELVRWFPLSAESKPGAGGEIVYRWGELEGRCRILAWEPPAHLRTGWMEAPGVAAAGTGAAAQISVDWFLEGAGGTTKLRIVHSGFSRDAAWDQEFDGTRRGWTFELRALKHYLERHRGQPRRAAWIRQPTALAPAEVWERFMQAGPIFRAVELAGDRFRLERTDGEVLAGRVLVHHPPLELAGTLASHGDGMLRLGFEACMGGPEAHVWLATWDLAEREFARLEAGWRDALRRAFAPDLAAKRG